MKDPDGYETTKQKENAMNNIKILLAEDDNNLGILLRNYLTAKNYETSLFINGSLALESFST